MGVLVMMQLSFIFMGMFLDDTAMLIIVIVFPQIALWLPNLYFGR